MRRLITQRPVLASLLAALVVPAIWAPSAFAQGQLTGQLTASPSQIEFGDVAIGSSASQTLTLTDTVDEPVTMRLIFVIAGTPSVWPITADGCSGQMLNPGDSCQLTLGFQPDETGYRDGSIIVALTPLNQVATVDGTSTTVGPATTTDVQDPVPVLKTLAPAEEPFGPVTVIGFSGTGMPTPDGAVTIAGNRAAGSTLTCDPSADPTDPSYTYQWLEDGRPLAGATGGTLPLVDAEVGQSFACRVLATNPVGSETMTSPATAPIAPMPLTEENGAFTDEGTCRIVQTSRVVRLGRESVGVDTHQPVTPWTPLGIHAHRVVQVRIDGQTVARGRVMAVTPQTLSNFADGPHVLEISDAGSSAEARLMLTPCSLAVRVDGGPGRWTMLAASSLYGMRSLTFHLPRGLRIDLRAGGVLGRATYKSNPYPLRSFELIGRRTSWNNVTVRLTASTITFGNLPIQTGVVKVWLRPGLLTGHGGTVGLEARERSLSFLVAATTPATWLR